MPLHDIARTLASHRLQEAAALAELAASILSDVLRHAGPMNGTAQQADGLSRDLLTLAARMRAAAERAARPAISATISINVDHDHARAVITAKGDCT